MNIFGIGIDIVDRERINKIYTKYGNKFAEKILNEREFKGFNLSKNKPSLWLSLYFYINKSNSESYIYS